MSHPLLGEGDGLELDNQFASFGISRESNSPDESNAMNPLRLCLLSWRCEGGPNPVAVVARIPKSWSASPNLG
jgi:hypothetical protein